jgi:2-iminobutanoate/2-iminopropanoate deaminase
MINIGELLKKAKSDYNNIFKCTVYLVDMGDFEKVNGVYAKFFTGDFPARTCIAVKELPKKGTIKTLINIFQH